MIHTLYPAAAEMLLHIMESSQQVSFLYHHYLFMCRLRHEADMKHV
jgi:hypothetical protein